MRQTTAIGLVVLGVSLATGLGGAGVVRHARGMLPPAAPPMRTLAGAVTGIVIAPCRNPNRHLTCHRPAVDYHDAGQRRQIVSRTAYSPRSPHKTGERVSVLVEPDGTAWIASEWNARQAVLQHDYENRRRFPLWMGWIVVGCAAFGVLLGGGLIFFVDRSGEPDA